MEDPVSRASLQNQSSNNMLRAVLRAPRAAQIMPRSTAPARAMGGGGAHPPSPNHVWSPGDRRAIAAFEVFRRLHFLGGESSPSVEDDGWSLFRF